MFQSVRTCYLLLAIIGISYSASIKDDILQEKIVIVGAGPAGIAAASKLLEYGYQNVVVLEAAARIGGRVQTEYLDGDNDKYIELGSHLIMGESGNIVYELAKKAGVIGTKVDELDRIYVKSNGENIPHEKILPLWLSYPDAISTFSNKMKPVSELFKEYVENIKTTDLDTETSVQFYRMIIEAFTPISNWADESGDGLTSFVNINGSASISLTTGAIGILHMMMNSYPDNHLSPNWKNVVQLNAEVEHIHWNKKNPIVQYTKTSDPHTLIDIEAEHVIVTVPLGVLKQKYKTLFVPDLPERKVNAIRNLAMASMNKVFLTYDHQWWPDNRTFFVVWNEADKDNLKKADQWLNNVLVFTAEEHYPKTITAWVVERDTVTTENHSDKEVYTKLATFVKEIFANQGWNITDPISARRTRWYHNPYSRGSYSYRGLRASDNRVTNVDLRESLRNDDGKKTVLFAGEATHDKYYGTMHGAIETGYTAGNKIHEIHNLP